MCGRFALIDWDGIAQRFLLSDAKFALLLERFEEAGGSRGPRYNIAPTQEVLTVTNDGDHNRAEMMRWGLVPSWARDPKIGSRMINARAETLAERPSFRVAFRRRRCLVVADSFYEWRRDGKRRVPMRISLESGAGVRVRGTVGDVEADGRRRDAVLRHNHHRGERAGGADP